MPECWKPLVVFKRVERFSRFGKLRRLSGGAELWNHPKPSEIVNLSPLGLPQGFIDVTDKSPRSTDASSVRLKSPKTFAHGRGVRATKRCPSDFCRSRLHWLVRYLNCSGNRVVQKPLNHRDELGGETFTAFQCSDTSDTCRSDGADHFTPPLIKPLRTLSDRRSPASGLASQLRGTGSKLPTEIVRTWKEIVQTWN